MAMKHCPTQPYRETGCWYYLLVTYRTRTIHSGRVVLSLLGSAAAVLRRDQWSGVTSATITIIHGLVPRAEPFYKA